MNKTSTDSAGGVEASVCALDALALAESALEHALLAVRSARAQTAQPVDELLDSRSTRERFGVGHEALLAANARGELELTRGPRRKVLVSRAALEAWLRSRRVEPRPRRKPAEVIDLDAWEREADRAMGGSR